MRFLLARERAPTTRFVAIQSALGRSLAERHGVDPETPSTFLFIEGSRALEKSDGVIALADHLRWPWRALTWGWIVPRRWRDALYDVLAGNRYRIFGRYDRCEIPPAGLRDRFVLPE